MKLFSPSEYRAKRDQLMELLAWAESFMADGTEEKKQAFAAWERCMAEGRDPNDLPPPSPDVVAWGVMNESIQQLQGLRDMRRSTGALWKPKQQEGIN